MKKENIAIILVNYNGISDTIECIKSIKNIKNENYKIIVVDNNSKNSEAERIEKSFPEIEIIKSNDNLGFSAGNNLGIMYAIKNEYEYILLLNNDTIIDPDMINNLLMYSNNKTITVPKMYYYYDNRRIWYGGGNINKYTGRAMHNNMNKLDENLVEDVEECSFATGCCMLIHTDIIKKIGGLNEEYFMYCEDTEYSLKALMNGIKIVYVPKAKLWHKVSKSTGGAISAFSVYYMTRNRFMYMEEYKNYFSIFAYYFTLFTRYIRIIQYKMKNDDIYKVIKKAIKDYKNKIIGRVDKFM